jgi:integrase
VSELTAHELERVKHSMVRQSDDAEVTRRSKDSANRVLNAFKACLNKLYKEGDVSNDRAWRELKRFRGVSKSRQAHLDADQCRALIAACEPVCFRNLVVAAILTGARPPHELAGLRVDDFDRKMHTLAVGGKTGRRDVWLSEEAAGFISEVAAGRPASSLLLPAPDGGAWRGNLHWKLMQAAVAKAGLPPNVTLYSLRHTHASQALLNGANMQVLAENMGTSIAMLQAHYGKYSAANRRKLIEASSIRLGLAINVTPLRRA